MIGQRISHDRLGKALSEMGMGVSHALPDKGFRGLLLVCFCVFLYFQPIVAQEELLSVFHFNRLTSTDGLPSPEIRSNVVRDRQGFIWIPTINGLARYDGYTCKVYRNNPDDSASISSNRLMSIYLDRRDRLWIGTWASGLTMYDGGKDRFLNFYPAKDDSTSLLCAYIFLIREDKQGNIWLLDPDNGVTCVNMSELCNITDTDSLRQRIRFRNYKFGPPQTRPWDIEGWRDSSVIVSSDRGFFVIDPVTRRVSRPQLMSTDHVQLDTMSNVALFRQNPTMLWLGTQSHELFKYDERNGMLIHYPPKGRGGQRLHTDVEYLQMDGFGNLWLGTGSGFELFDTASGTYRDYLCSPSAGPTHEGIKSKRMSLDASGTFWVSGGKSGLYYLLRRSKLFSHYGVRDTARKALEIGTIEPWSDGTVWIEGNGKAINVEPRTLRVLRECELLKGERPLYWRTGAEDSYNDGKGNIWYGTWGLGLYRFEPASGRVTNYRASAQLPGKTRDICWSVSKGIGETLWISGNTDGLLCFDLQTHRYSLPTDSLLRSCRNVSHVLRDELGRFWVSDQRLGLILVDPSGNVVGRFEHNHLDPSSIAFAEVRDTYQDSRGRIWIGGPNLDLWEPTTQSFRHFPNLQKSQTDFVKPIGSDAKGRLWVRYSGMGFAILDPATGSYSNFDRSDGLCDNVITMSPLPDGRILLVGTNGLNVVNPDTMWGEYNVPPVVLTNISVNDSIDINLQTVTTSTQLGLSYTQNVLEFEFAAIDPGGQHRISYRYKFEGLDDGWIDPKGRRSVRYPGLSPGDYVFRVKAVNRYGRWPDQERAIAVSIAPPWWRAWWAYSAYGILLAGLLFLGYRLRLRQIQLQQNADMEHFQAERLAEVDRLKSRFFANISHEFRTPLTLILGPADQAIETTQEPSTRQKLKLIRDNAGKLYGLVSQLLDFSQVESGTMKLTVSEGEVIGFLRRIVMSFESWAERKKICLRFISAVESVAGFFDADTLEKIMNNLLSNALKFTPEGKSVEVIVRCSVRSEGGNNEIDYVEINVTDTGPGISTEHLPNIFNRFYRADNSHAVEGTGIGLALVWELTQLHHGTIVVESMPGIGTQFTLSIPIGRTAYKPEEIAESPAGITMKEGYTITESSTGHEASSPEVIVDGKPIVLVVEDNADLRVYIREFLATNYAVHEAGDGREGFERATEIIPDIVISDVMMPEMDGVELCRALKQDVRTSHVPVILLTARAGTDSKIEGLETGADDYVTKPFDAKELLARVKNLIESRKQLRKKFSAGMVLKPGDVAVTSLDDRLLKNIMTVIERNMARDEFSVDDLAKDVCLSRSGLNRKVHALTNLTPVELIRYVRLQRAREMLENNGGTVADIAYQVGFTSPAYFSSCFHERFGVIPSQVRGESLSPGL
jgi:signal transduction histidine kinase/DNA-binding response OmpR family regulator/ligand-binding sensor domain-containing protein